MDDTSKAAPSTTGTPGGYDMSQGLFDKMLGLNNEAFSAVDALEKQRRESRQKTVQTLTKISGEEASLGFKPIEAPPPLHLEAFKDVKAPNPEFKDPSKALSSTWGIFAVLGSFAARRPAVAAMRALAGIMKGNYQGQKDQFEQDWKKYMANMQIAQAEMQKEVAEYNAMWHKAEWNAQRRESEMRAYAQLRQDTMMLQKLNEEDYVGQEQLILSKKDALVNVWTQQAKFYEQLLKTSGTKYSAGMMKADFDADSARASWAMVPEEMKKQLQDQEKQQGGNMLTAQWADLRDLRKRAKIDPVNGKPMPLYRDQMSGVPGGGATTEAPVAPNSPQAQKLAQSALDNGHSYETVKAEWTKEGGDPNYFDATFKQGSEPEPEPHPRPQIPENMPDTSKPFVWDRD